MEEYCNFFIFGIYVTLFVLTVFILFEYYKKRKSDLEIKSLGLTKYVCERLKNVSYQNIIEAHKKIEHITKHNIGNYEPTSCGTVANAMLKIVPSIIKTSNEFLMDFCITGSGLSINKLRKIIKSHKNDYHSYVYNIGTDSKPVYKLNKKDEFSGHAFVIIKLSNKEYIFTQSYIYKYGHGECTKTISFSQVKKILNIFNSISKSSKITEDFCNKWKELTLISIKELKNFCTKNNE